MSRQNPHLPRHYVENETQEDVVSEQDYKEADMPEPAAEAVQKTVSSGQGPEDMEQMDMESMFFGH